MKAIVWRTVLAAALAALAAYCRELVIPLGVLLLVMLADYGTGMTRAWITRSFSSRSGIRGIVKKLLYLVLVAVGMTADYLIAGALHGAGVDLPAAGFIGLLVTAWLIINELISILENLAECGVPVPAFLVKLIHRLKLVTEEKGNTGSDGEPRDS